MAILVDFKCQDCGHVFEAFNKDNVKCDNCGSVNIEKQLSSPAQLITNAADKSSHRSRNRHRK